MVPIAGVEFGVFNAEDDKQVDTMFTDEKGFASSHELAYGDYYVQEVKSVDKYHVDKTEYCFSINENGEVEFLNSGLPILNTLKQGRLDLMKVSNETVEHEVTINVVNDLIEAYIEVNKIDRKTGEEFNVIDEAGKVVDKLKTSCDGTAKSKKVPYGTYTIKEVKAPTNYQINSKDQTVTIGKDDNEKVVYTTVEDDKKQAEVCTGLDENNNEIIETVDIDKVEENKGDCEVKEQPK